MSPFYKPKCNDLTTYMLIHALLHIWSHMSKSKLRVNSDYGQLYHAEAQMPLFPSLHYSEPNHAQALL